MNEKTGKAGGEAGSIPPLADAAPATPAPSHPALVNSVPSSSAGAACQTGANPAGSGYRPQFDLGATVLVSMPVVLHVGVPLHGFRLETLAGLEPGAVVSSQWANSEDLPVSAGRVRMAWAEFAVTDRARSVRVTRIA